MRCQVRGVATAVAHRRFANAATPCKCARANGYLRLMRALLSPRIQAGTYVKEFVHGDFGRTRPSLGSLLGCQSDILQLDVTAVNLAFV